ncbi:hypothetical protein PybrP1_003294, partial [[Pythium] brassicae (nom. inval.)]
EVNLYFFIKGHTKNSCDRGFGVVRRNVATRDIYTLQQLSDAVSEASVSSECVLPGPCRASCFPTPSQTCSTCGAPSTTLW